jgi:ZIP family zinc transporter
MDADGDHADGSPLAIVLGSVLDGILESLVIGLTIFEGGAVGAAYLGPYSSQPARVDLRDHRSGQRRLEEVAHLVDVDLHRGGLRHRVRGRLCPVPGLLTRHHRLRPRVRAGDILTMLADTMMPEAFEHGGKLIGVVTALGFATAYGIHALS